MGKSVSVPSKGSTSCAAHCEACLLYKCWDLTICSQPAHQIPSRNRARIPLSLFSARESVTIGTTTTKILAASCRGPLPDPSCVSRSSSRTVKLNHVGATLPVHLLIEGTHKQHQSIRFSTGPFSIFRLFAEAVCYSGWNADSAPSLSAGVGVSRCAVARCAAGQHGALPAPGRRPWGQAAGDGVHRPSVPGGRQR